MSSELFCFLDLRIVGSRQFRRMWVQRFSLETFTGDIFTLASLRVSASRYVGTVHGWQSQHDLRLKHGCCHGFYMAY